VVVVMLGAAVAIVVVVVVVVVLVVVIAAVVGALLAVAQLGLVYFSIEVPCSGLSPAVRTVYCCSYRLWAQPSQIVGFAPVGDLADV